jgi:hypothetical protein
MMANPTDIVRTISGKGEIRIPDDFKDTSSIFLYVQVLRKVFTPSINFTWNPDKSFYAHVCFCKDNYVLQTYDINFEEQGFQVWDGMDAQNLLAIKCLASQLIPNESLITQMEYNSFPANKIKFECFGSTALILTLKGDALDVCLEEHKRPQPPPPPPDRVPQLPPGTPTQVSPPYEDEDGEEDTQPFPPDEFPQPSVGFLIFAVLDQTGQQLFWYINAVEGQSVVFQPGNDPNCPNGGADLYVNSELYYRTYACQATVNIESQAFVAEVPSEPAYEFLAPNL